MVGFTSNRLGSVGDSPRKLAFGQQLDSLIGLGESVIVGGVLAGQVDK